MILVALLLAIGYSYLLWLDVLPLAKRLVAVAERQAGITAAPVAVPEPVVERERLPPDIELLAANESEEWARDSVRDRAWELYRHLNQDWDAAKRVLYAERQLTLFGGDLNNGVS